MAVALPRWSPPSSGGVLAASPTGTVTAEVARKRTKTAVLVVTDGRLNNSNSR